MALKNKSRMIREAYIYKKRIWLMNWLRKEKMFKFH
ncbi:hypothetical protein IMSAGC022_01404 [Alistipes sp.]|nr:hypothetical protein IMSAGC022_01404 [Alistipes sp.]